MTPFARRCYWLKWKVEWNQSISKVSVVYGYIVKCSLWEINAEVIGVDVSGQQHTHSLEGGKLLPLLSSWLYKK